MDSRERLLNMLAEVELTVSRLYEKYAGIFPEHKEFWQGMAAEEQKHASLIKILSAQNVNEDRLQLELVQSTLAYIKDQLAMASKQAVSLPDALSTASNIENSLIEKAFYAAFNADTEEIKRVLREIVNETNQHRSKVQELLTKKQV